MNIPEVRSEYLVAKLNLYAFALTPGSGKTFNSKKHPRIIDIDRAVSYTPELLKLMSENKWKKVLKIKSDSLENHVIANYTDKTGNLILLVHDPEEAKYVNATLLGAYKIPYDKMIETKGNSKWAENAWHAAKKYEIKTHEEIGRIINDSITKYL